MLGASRVGALGLANASEAKLRRGPVCGRASGATLAATNDLSAGSVCKRRDAVTLGRKKGLQPRANERPAGSFSFKLARAYPVGLSRDLDSELQKVMRRNSRAALKTS